MRMERSGTGRVDSKVREKVEFLLEKGRRHFGEAGASLTHQIENPLSLKGSGITSALAKRGYEGEKKTSKVLKEWAERTGLGVLIDSVHLKGYGKEYVNEQTGEVEGGDTDHVLIVGNSVFMIDSKHWKSNYIYRVDEKSYVKRGKRMFSGSRVRAYQAKILMSKYLKRYSGVKCQSLVVVTSKGAKVVKDKHWYKAGYYLITVDELIGFLDKFVKKHKIEEDPFINVDLVSDLVTQAVKPHNVVMEQLQNLQYLLT